jgi:hypothetical protein
MSKTDVYSVRVDIRLHAIGAILIRRHPRTLSHSWIYAEGLKTIIAAAIEQGENIPDDPIGEILKINKKALAELQAETDALTNLQKKHQEQASRTLAGSCGPRIGCKPHPDGGFAEPTYD